MTPCLIDSFRFEFSLSEYFSVSTLWHCCMFSFEIYSVFALKLKKKIYNPVLGVKLDIKNLPFIRIANNIVNKN